MSKKIFLAALFTLWGLGGFAQTTIIDSGTCGANLTWVLTSDSVLTISGSGAMDNYMYYGSNVSPWSSSLGYIKTVIIGDSITTIGSATFADCYVLTSVSIGNSVTTIRDFAFYDCKNLTSVIIPNSVITIENAVFYGCNNLISITIPNSVTTIGNLVFSYCDGLTSVTIGNSVTRIGYYAFSPCIGLTSITCRAIVPPATSSTAFIDVNTTIPIYVPCGSVLTYQQDTNWNKFTNFVDIIFDTTFYSASFCQGGSYSDANFSNLTTAGLHYKTLQKLNGCDSIIELALAVKSLKSFVIYDTICSNNAYIKHSFIIPASKLQIAGTFEFHDTIPSATSCDSIIKLILTVKSVYFTKISDSISAGESYDFNGKQLTTAGIYYDTLKTVFGCDSVIELTLMVGNVGIVGAYRIRPIQIYPNPTDGKIVVSGQLLNVSVEIFDVVGKLVYTSPQPSPKERENPQYYRH